MLDDAVRSLIINRYDAAHGAIAAADYPAYLTVGTPELPQAVLGFRRAGAAPIFLERYLDRPVETLLAERLGRPVARDRIVELGDHASQRPSATIALWREAAAALDGQAEIAVAVLTKSLRSMFARLGFDLMLLASARLEALGSAAADWGRYYETDPVLCAGDIAACRMRLDGRSRA